MTFALVVQSQGSRKESGVLEEVTEPGTLSAHRVSQEQPMPESEKGLEKEQVIGTHPRDSGNSLEGFLWPNLGQF